MSVWKVPTEPSETPRQRAFRWCKESIYWAIALALAIASVLGVLNPWIGA